MAPTPYIVYYAIDSLCSYMLRYSIAIRGPSKDGVEIALEEKVIDIHYKREHLTEPFLLKVNPKGQVPVLAGPALEKPMPDSLDITNYLATMFPNLKPAGYETQIDEMLARIHAVPYFVLSFGQHNAAPIPKGTVETMRQILQQDNISDEYRKALETKLAAVSSIDFNNLFSPGSVKQAEEAVQPFFKYVDERLPSSDGWLLGLPHPTAADAHLVALLVRLKDVGRAPLLPTKLRAFAERARATREWQSLMGGLETTMCPG